MFCVPLANKLRSVLLYRRKDRVYWECTFRHGKGERCPATVSQHIDQFTCGRSEHCHERVVGLDTAVEVRQNIRTKVKAEMFAPASTIVTAAVQAINMNEPHDQMPALHNMVCMVYKTQVQLHGLTT